MFKRGVNHGGEERRHRMPSTDGQTARFCWQAAILLYPFFLYFLTTLALPVGLVVLALYARRYFMEKDPQVGTGAYGTARFALRADIENAGMLENDGGLLVGRVAPMSPPLWRSQKSLGPWCEDPRPSSGSTSLSCEGWSATGGLSSGV